MTRILRVCLALCALLLGTLLEAAPASPPLVLSLRIEGAIGPATSDYVSTVFRQAHSRNASLILMEMDTPGGLDTAMRAIIKEILASSIPVATYVAPDGARAASAGTYILYASHVAAMAPATNLGAATPINIGAGEQDNDASRNPSAAKATNDASAYLRSLAQLRKRDPAFAEQAVLQAASLTAQEALDKGVIELVARNRDDLLQQLHGRAVTLDNGQTLTLATEDAVVETALPDWRNGILAVLSDPQVAMVLMMIGIYGLFFEFTSPGFGVPGVAGLICLLLALYAFQLLPVNWAGVALIVLGALLMLGEVFMPSFGVLGIGGLVAFLTGALLLFDREIPGYGLPLPFLIGTALCSAVVLLGTGTFALRARRQRVVSGGEQLVGQTGPVIAVQEGQAYAHIHGERWRVRSDTPLTLGQQVRVIRMEGLTLHVEPTEFTTATRSPP